MRRAPGLNLVLMQLLLSGGSRFAHLDDHIGPDRRSPPFAQVTYCRIRYYVARQHVWHPHPPGLQLIPSAAITIGGAGIILRSSTACSVTRYLPRTGAFIHCASSELQSFACSVITLGTGLGQREVSAAAHCPADDGQLQASHRQPPASHGQLQTSHRQPSAGDSRPRVRGPGHGDASSVAGATEEAPPGARAVQNRYGCLCTEALATLGPYDGTAAGGQPCKKPVTPSL